MKEKNAALCRDAATPVTAGTEAKAQRSTGGNGQALWNFILFVW
jgi:hypothetical protein